MNSKRARPSHKRARASARLARSAASVGSSTPLGMRLRASRSALVIVDVHERLLHTIADVERVVDRCAALMKMARLLHVPMFVTEHVPHKLGPTTESLRSLVTSDEIFSKRYFSAADEPSIAHKFALEYERRFAEAPTFFAAQSFDGLLALAEAMRACPQVSSQCVRGKLGEISVEGASGPVRFDVNGDVKGKPLCFKRVSGGRFIDA